MLLGRFGHSVPHEVADNAGLGGFGDELDIDSLAQGVRLFIAMIASNRRIIRPRAETTQQLPPFNYCRPVMILHRLAISFAVFSLLITAAASAQSGDRSPAASDTGAETGTDSETVATLAGGCFWCTEAVFEQMKGVTDVVSGYIGGSVPNPTYEQVTGKRTGHAEAVEVYYDPDVVTYEEILEVFFKTHDPTTPNQQGYDYGPQYRSVVFFHNEEQEATAKAIIKKLDAKQEFPNPIVTEVVKADRFWLAEDYHQDYFRKNPTAAYCRGVVSKKVKKFNSLFEDKKKETVR